MLSCSHSLLPLYVWFFFFSVWLFCFGEFLLPDPPALQKNATPALQSLFQNKTSVKVSLWEHCIGQGSSRRCWTLFLDQSCALVAQPAYSKANTAGKVQGSRSVLLLCWQLSAALGQPQDSARQISHTTIKNPVNHLQWVFCTIIIRRIRLR